MRTLYNRDYITPLGRAATKGNDVAVAILIQSGCRLVDTSSAYSPLLLAILNRQRPDILRLFLQRTDCDVQHVSTMKRDNDNVRQLAIFK
jgi:ankyrin repeat protein